MPFTPHTSFRPVRRIEDYIFIAFLVFGFILALASGSAMIYYMVSFLTGMFFGRLLFKKKGSIKFQSYIMVVFFMVGFVIGNALTRYGDPKITILVYFLGILISYYIFSKRWLRVLDI